ncbi:hypothetical protein L6452_19127 [Arctium lappa]|uniref:Uncharacterized protein n=1 Tax=Arctium lappa TaxID=4217 RepID=A0ACB9B9K6_ARCLA|nr:hypothetical protein L6452_19127 [Arctium lappa]
MQREDGNSNKPLLMEIPRIQVLTIFTGALLEKQIVFVCSNLVHTIVLPFLTLESVASIGNIVCFSVVNYPPNSSLPLAKLLNVGIGFMICSSVYNARICYGLLKYQLRSSLIP